jgi:hypothetical protein
MTICKHRPLLADWKDDNHECHESREYKETSFVAFARFVVNFPSFESFEVLFLDCGIAQGDAALHDLLVRLRLNDCKCS